MPPRQFPEQVRDLIAWTRGQRTRASWPTRGRPATDGGFDRAPEVWVLGSSDYGAQLAAHLRPALRLRLLLHGRPRGRAGPVAVPPAVQGPSDRHPRRSRRSASGPWPPTPPPTPVPPRTEPRALAHRPPAQCAGPAAAPDDIAARGFTAEEDADLEPMRRAPSSAPAPRWRRIRALAANWAWPRSSSTPGPTTRRCAATRTRCWRANSA
jgi:hypothetical protein